MTNLNNLTLAELNALQARVADQIKARTADDINKVRQEILSLAASVGMTVDQILKTKTKGEVKTVAPRFRHPDQPELVWTGRGRKPRWIQEFIEKTGKNIDSLLIEKK